MKSIKTSLPIYSQGGKDLLCRLYLWVNHEGIMYVICRNYVGYFYK
jgi:hypothetical protein